MTWEEYSKDSIDVHFDRAKFFFACALNAKSEKEAENCFVACIYFCRAPFEILVTRAKNKQIDIECDKLFSEAEGNIRHFKIIEAARVQDFHRTAIRFKTGTMMMGGPITIKSGAQTGGGASFSVTADGERIKEIQGNSSVKLNRPIQIHGFSIYSEVLKKLIPIQNIIDEYLIDIQNFVTRNNIKNNT